MNMQEEQRVFENILPFFVKREQIRYSLISGSLASSEKRQGITLLEVLVVVTIIGVLAFLILPVTGKIQASVKSAKCVTQLRQIGVAMNSYANENNNQYPRAYASEVGDTETWMWKIARYLDIPQNAMGPAPKPRAVGILICPEYEMAPGQERVASYGISRYIDPKTNPQGGAWDYRRNNVPSTTTILVAEIEVNNEHAYAERIVRRHPNGSANYLFVDGHVENLNDIIPASDLRWRGQ